MKKLHLLDDNVFGCLLRISLGLETSSHLKYLYKETIGADQIQSYEIASIESSFRYIKSRNLFSIHIDSWPGGYTFKERVYAKLLRHSDTNVSPLLFSIISTEEKKPQKVETVALTQAEREEMENDAIIAEEKLFNDVENPQPLRQELIVEITFSEKQKQDLGMFLTEYINEYDKRKLVGQKQLLLPSAYRKQFLSKVDDPIFIENYGKNEIAVTNKNIQMFCHSLFSLHLAKQIEILNLSPQPVELDHGVIGQEWEAEINNFSQGVPDEKNVFLKKSTGKKIFLPELSDNIKWQDITIRFLNTHEVIIMAKDTRWQTTYEQMGFQDEKRKLPNRQWELLYGFALKKGEYSWDNNNNLPQKEKIALKKRKQLLADALISYFQINEDPFYPYKQYRAYKIKINLIAEATSNNPFDGDEKIEIDESIKEYFKNQSPEIYDPSER